MEDNDLNREIAYELLQETGAEIETASDGLEAVNKVSASPEGYYDFIIMDIQMPVMDGLEATRQIRLLDRQDTKDLPIVAMVGQRFCRRRAAKPGSRNERTYRQTHRNRQALQCYGKVVPLNTPNRFISTAHR